MVKVKGDGTAKLGRYFRWFPLLFKQATEMMSLPERGLYREILDQLFLNDGYLPLDEKKLRHMVGCEQDDWDRWWPAVREKLTIENGQVTHEIPRAQATELNDRISRARAAAHARWEKAGKGSNPKKGKADSDDAVRNARRNAKSEPAPRSEVDGHSNPKETKDISSMPFAYAKGNKTQSVGTLSASQGREESEEGGDPAIVSAPADAGAPEPISFMLKNGHKWILEPDEMRQFAADYARPGEPVESVLIWVVSEARKASSWCRVNPAKRKTKTGMRRFLNSWLSRSDEKLGPVRASQSRQSSRTDLQDRWDAIMSQPFDVKTPEEEREAARKHLASLGLDPDGDL